MGKGDGMAMRPLSGAGLAVITDDGDNLRR
jgi:hypothetical protein